MKVRIDQLLVSRGLFDSRAQARAAIEAGLVIVDAIAVRRPSDKVADDAVIEARAAHRWVGRGALKLDHALSIWPVEVAGRIVLDVGASTGGFTEVCLERGAARVFAVDVGHGQLHARIAADHRVIDLERTDARGLSEAMVGRPDLIVCDASFISLMKVLTAALSIAADAADLIALVKPQFEAERASDVGRGGVVRDEAQRRQAVRRVSDWLAAVGWTVRQVAESPVTGGDGNVEYLLWAQRKPG